MSEKHVFTQYPKERRTETFTTPMGNETFSTDKFKHPVPRHREQE